MQEVIGYKCLICGARLHDIGEHRELTGHEDFEPIYEKEAK